MPCDNCACGTQNTADAVPLPRAAPATSAAAAAAAAAAGYGATSSEQTPLLWKTTPAASSASLTAPAPAAAQTDSSCGRHHLVRRGGVRCCKELNQDAANSAHSPAFVDPDVIRDVIIGLSDGLSVPFALAAALSALGSTRIVVIGGLAELVSGAISMGVGGFLSAQAELDHYRNQARSTHERVSRSCLAEMKREVAAILEPFGLGADVAEKVAERLANVEQAAALGAAATATATPSGTDASDGTLPLPASSARRFSQGSHTTHASAADAAAPEAGLTPFLLKLGAGLEPISPSRAYISAATIGLSYFLGGLVPLIPYMIWSRVREALLVSIAVTGIVLLLFGAVKHRFTGGEGSVRAYAYAAFSTLSVGGIAAAASWSIVRAIEGHE